LLASDDLKLVVVPAKPLTSGAWFEGVTVLSCPPSLRTIYLQPASTGLAGDIIDFDTISSHVSQYDDDLSRQFALHLARWSHAPGIQPSAEA
jgi:hypothetical protein